MRPFDQDSEVPLISAKILVSGTKTKKRLIADTRSGWTPGMASLPIVSRCDRTAEIELYAMGTYNSLTELRKKHRKRGVRPAYLEECLAFIAQTDHPLVWEEDFLSIGARRRFRNNWYGYFWSESGELFFWNQRSGTPFQGWLYLTVREKTKTNASP